MEISQPTLSQQLDIMRQLNLAHPWDPSLAFVMMGAILIGLIGFIFVIIITKLK
ncbi:MULTISPECIES: DUF6691 family protein [Xenorhabdus]|uniref:DUF6691 family protein n=1 Tax=Xenorhabdus TaxID=626 RepID=UPI00142D1F2B|nr:DUF6691 family protein [Xenorhabdus ehlersii]